MQTSILYYRTGCITLDHQEYLDEASAQEDFTQTLAELKTKLSAVDGTGMFYLFVNRLIHRGGYSGQVRSSQVWGHTPEQRVAASTL